MELGEAVKRYNELVLRGEDIPEEVGSIVLDNLALAQSFGDDELLYFSSPTPVLLIRSEVKSNG